MASATTTRRERTLRSRVRKGVRLLDRELGPHWPRKIKRARLEMSSGDCCILGQAYGSEEEHVGYVVGRKSLGLTDKQAEEFGFYSSNGVPSYDKLTKLWKEELRGRR